MYHVIFDANMTEYTFSLRFADEGLASLKTKQSLRRQLCLISDRPQSKDLCPPSVSDLFFYLFLFSSVFLMFLLSAFRVFFY